MNDAYRELNEKLSESERMLIASLFFDTAKRIIVENAPKDLTENQLKRYIYEKMNEEPAPSGLWE